MNTNSYFARNDDTCRITLSTLLAFMLSLVVGTKSLFAQPAMALAAVARLWLRVWGLAPVLACWCFAGLGLGSLPPLALPPAPSPVAFPATPAVRQGVHSPLRPP